MFESHYGVTRFFYLRFLPCECEHLCTVVDWRYLSYYINWSRLADRTDMGREATGTDSDQNVQACRQDRQGTRGDRYGYLRFTWPKCHEDLGNNPFKGIQIDRPILRGGLRPPPKPPCDSGRGSRPSPNPCRMF